MILWSRKKKSTLKCNSDVESADMGFKAAIMSVQGLKRKYNVSEWQDG